MNTARIPIPGVAVMSGGSATPGLLTKGDQPDAPQDLKDAIGCASQTLVANQVDDPLDRVRPRPETKADVQRRMTTFDEACGSNDPSATWNTGNATGSGSTSGGGGSGGGH